jgi:hypothetical protein
MALGIETLPKWNKSARGFSFRVKSLKMHDGVPTLWEKGDGLCGAKLRIIVSVTFWPSGRGGIESGGLHVSI